MRRRLAFAAGLFASGLFIWLALRDANWTDIRNGLMAAKFVWAAPFLLALFAFYWLKSVRWQYLLSTAAEASSRELFPMVMIGYAGTAVLPMQMGEFVRAYLASVRYSLRYSQVLGSIFVERVFDLLTILVLIGAVLAGNQELPDGLVTSGYVISAIAAAAIVATVLLVTRTDTVVALTRILLTPLPARFVEAVTEQLRAAADGLTVITNGALMRKVAVNSLLQWGLMGACIWVSLQALGIHLPVSGALLVLAATIVGISLPTSPGYVGNIQLAFVVALTPYDIPASQAIAASVFYHVLAYVSVVVVGFFFLQKSGLGFGELKDRAESDAAAS